MDICCEYCVNLRSVVYCEADAAFLCLSCDTKVHSANPLSRRHRRTLICECCKHSPTYIRCYDHQRFMCRGCDLSQHDSSHQHRKEVVNGYSGCPSPSELSVLWGFNLNQFRSFLNGHVSSQIQHQEQKLENDFDPFLQQTAACGVHHLGPDPCSPPFAQLDHLASSETAEGALQGDSFWQCENPVQTRQLWSHNMDDLGVCEEAACLDDLNIPDIDLTFRNFEELFRTEEEPTGDGVATATEDTSMATSVTITESSPKKARYASQIMPFCHSRLDAESSGTGCDNQTETSGYGKARPDARK